MMYVEFNAGNQQYKLRLNIRSTVALEKHLGVNPLMIFEDGDKIPTITTMVAILQASLQHYHHSIGVNEAYNIFEAWLNDGNTMVDFLPVIIDIYKVSGIIKDEPAAEKN